MHYIKLETSDGETRWINLARVSRVTAAVGTATGDEMVVLMFADPGENLTLKLNASNDQDRAAIKVLLANLDALVEHHCMA